MAESKISVTLRDNEKISKIIHTVIVTLMLALMVYGLVQVGHYIFPSWNGGYLVVIGALVANEALAWRGRAFA